MVGPAGIPMVELERDVGADLILPLLTFRGALDIDSAVSRRSLDPLREGTVELDVQRTRPVREDLHLQCRENTLRRSGSVER